MTPNHPAVTGTSEGETHAARPSLGALALLFLKLGAIGFGGGMAVIALLEHELIQRRKLMGQEEFLHQRGGVSPGRKYQKYSSR